MREGRSRPSPMRFLALAQLYLPYYAGAEIVLHEFLKYLALRGHECMVLTDHRAKAQ